MSQKLIDKKISPRCSYCAYGTEAADGSVLCEKKGVMQPSSYCKKFRYDPLKRQPPVREEEKPFSPEDFQL